MYEVEDLKLYQNAKEQYRILIIMQFCDFAIRIHRKIMFLKNKQKVHLKYNF